MDPAVARHIIEDHPDVPKRYRYAHFFWSWVWLLLGLISCGLIPALLGMRQAINSSARDFVLEVAEEDPAFYEGLMSNNLLRLELRADR
jgi:hypothetical protein